MSDQAFRIGFLLFPNITQLDLTGPYEMLAAMPGAKIHLIWKTLEPVASGRGLRIVPDTTLADCPQLDLICVPGGPGMNPLLVDDEVLGFLRRQAAGARYVTSVCTGSLVLGAAGLLKGRRAASHWMARDLLAQFGATPVDERVVVDGNLITGGGVTAGIDFALTVISELRGPEAAMAVQLGMEYAPAPPFGAGTPESAPAAVREAVTKMAAPLRAERERLVGRAAAALK
jgi:cyclohexyl-isocyanide hydratase